MSENTIVTEDQINFQIRTAGAFATSALTTALTLARRKGEVRNALNPKRIESPDFDFVAHAQTIGEIAALQLFNLYPESFSDSQREIITDEFTQATQHEARLFGQGPQRTILEVGPGGTMQAIAQDTGYRVCNEKGSHTVIVQTLEQTFGKLRQTDVKDLESLFPLEMVSEKRPLFIARNMAGVYSGKAILSISKKVLYMPITDVAKIFRTTPMPDLARTNLYAPDTTEGKLISAIKILAHANWMIGMVGGKLVDPEFKYNYSNDYRLNLYQDMIKTAIRTEGVDEAVKLSTLDLNQFLAYLLYSNPMNFIHKIQYAGLIASSTIQ